MKNWYQGVANAFFFFFFFFFFFYIWKKFKCIAYEAIVSSNNRDPNITWFDFYTGNFRSEKFELFTIFHYKSFK